MKDFWPDRENQVVVNVLLLLQDLSVHNIFCKTFIICFFLLFWPLEILTVKKIYIITSYILIVILTSITAVFYILNYQLSTNRIDRKLSKVLTSTKFLFTIFSADYLYFVFLFCHYVKSTWISHWEHSLIFLDRN